MDVLQKIAQMGFPVHGTPEEFTVIHHSGSGVVARYEETGKKCGFFTVRVGADRGLDKRAARAVEEHCESRARASCAKGVLLTYSFGNPNKNNFPKFQKIRKIGDAQYEYEILEIVPKSYERLCENYNALFEAAKK